MTRWMKLVHWPEQKRESHFLETGLPIVQMFPCSGQIRRIPDQWPESSTSPTGDARLWQGMLTYVKQLTWQRRISLNSLFWLLNTARWAVNAALSCTNPAPQHTICEQPPAGIGRFWNPAKPGTMTYRVGQRKTIYRPSLFLPSFFPQDRTLLHQISLKKKLLSNTSSNIVSDPIGRCCNDARAKIAKINWIFCPILGRPPSCGKCYWLFEKYQGTSLLERMLNQ